MPSQTETHRRSSISTSCRFQRGFSAESRAAQAENLAMISERVPLRMRWLVLICTTHTASKTYVLITNANTDLLSRFAFQARRNASRQKLARQDREISRLSALVKSQEDQLADYEQEIDAHMQRHSAMTAGTVRELCFLVSSSGKLMQRSSAIDHHCYHHRRDPFVDSWPKAQSIVHSR